jgi:hypothetical protein
LEALKALEATNAIAANVERRRQAEAAQKLIDDQNKQLQESQDQKQEQITEESQNEQLNNEFTSQVNLQSVGSGRASGTRVKRAAIITGAPGDIVKIFSKVLFECYKNPKFEGHIKRDKKGIAAPEENGVPVYNKWAETLLDFLANNTDATVEGITFKEIAGTVAKAK